MKCKKSLMGLAALLILIFHFYITFTGTKLEQSIYRAAYIGVDIFFFVSAYSLAKRGVASYFSFIRNRFMSIYVPFILFSVVGAIYGKWAISRFFKVIVGIEFVTKGGGAFLWFFTAIMILYILAPLMIRFKDKFGVAAFIIMLAAWIVIAAMLEFAFKYKPLFIMVNRLPVFLLGLYYDKIRHFFIKKNGLVVSVPLLVAGALLIYKYASIQFLNKPVYNMYYIVAIPFVFALITIWDYVSENVTIKNIPLSFIGGFTLELYALQMIFGYKIEMKIMGMLNRFKPGAFLFTAVILILLAWIVNITKTMVIKLIKKK